MGDQVVLRTRAAHLADCSSIDPAQEPEAGPLAAARRIVAVLDDPDATVADLARVVAPVAEQCPDLRSTSPDTAAACRARPARRRMVVTRS